MKLCGAPSIVAGAERCPLELGHAGECLWWIPFTLGPEDNWRVVVYSGDPLERVRRCRGSFHREPDIWDVHGLLVLVEQLRAIEAQRREERCRDPQPAQFTELVPWSTPESPTESDALPTARARQPSSRAARAARAAARRAAAAAGSA